MGTLRWFNPSEEQHEQLTKATIYSTDVGKNTGIFFWDNQKQANPAVFFSAKNSDIQEALQTVAPEKAAKIRVRVVQMQEVTTAKENDSAKTPIVFQSPIELQVKPEDLPMPEGYPETINTVIAGNYFRSTLWHFPIIVDRDRMSPRGQMSNESVILSGKVRSLSEVAKVLVHELGHIVDIYVLRSSWLMADPSKLFYALSWSDTTVIKSGVSSSAFVSGYAASNQYEDFAESFAMYVFHNKVFQERAQKNTFLQRKYDFLHTYVFGEIFRNSSYEQSAIPAKIWDVTKVVIRSDALSEVFTALRYIISEVV